MLTQDLSSDHAPVLSRYGSASVPLVGVLDKSVTLVNGAAHDHAILAKDGLHVGFGHQHGVQVPDEDARVQRTWVRLIGHVAGHRVRGAAKAAPKKHKLLLLKHHHIKHSPDLWERAGDFSSFYLHHNSEE